MSASTMPERVPAAPRPPDEATWYRLDARAGWREALPPTGVEREPGGVAMTLARAAASRRRLDEPSGSLGGLVPPAHVAVAGDGSPYLLDRARRRLLRFDPCRCVFEPLPCAAERGPRALRDPRAIAISGATLYVAEAGDTTGGGRVSVWTLPELALRAEWPGGAPAAGEVPWQPVAIAADGRGGVWVGDRANAAVYRLDRFGRRSVTLRGRGGVRFLAVDRAGRLYVLHDADAHAWVFAPDGLPLGTASDPEALRSRFGCPAVVTDGAGRLDLRALCEGGTAGWFDATGVPIAAPDASGAVYETDGEWICGPLDSQLWRCQWDRVALTADIPVNTRVSIATWTAEAVIPASELGSLPESAWATRLDVTPASGPEWDAMIRSAPGRHLWLRVRLSGDGSATPRVHAARVVFPRISLRRYLPAAWGEDALAADFTDRFLAVFDAGFREIEGRLDTQASLYDPLSTPAAMLPWLASWIGASLGRQWPEDVRRRWVKRAAGFFARQGTRAGLREQLLFFLDMEGCAPRACPPEGVPCITRCEPAPGPCGRREPPPSRWESPTLVLEHYQLRRWLFLGAGRLGDQAVLWGQRIVNRSQLTASGPAAAAASAADACTPTPETSGASAAFERTGGAQVGATQLVTTPDPLRDPFHVHAHQFTVFVPAARARTPERRQALRRVIAAAAPAHTKWNVEYVEPRMRIGFQSAIGLDAVVGRYPLGVTLAGESPGTPLGRASVLGGASPPDRARIGRTAHL